MATIDMADFLGAGIPASVHSNRFVYHYAEVDIDLTEAATEKGSALAAADVIQAIDLPANSVVMAAGLEVKTANGGSSVLTLDLGVTGIDVDAYVDGFDFVAAVAGDFSAQPAAYQPIVIGNTADTLDLLVASLTDANTAGVVRVWCIYGDVKDQRKPGITARKS